MPGAKHRVLVLDFQNTAKNPTYEYLKRGLSDAVKAGLTKSAKLEVVDQKTFEKLHPNALPAKLSPAEAAELAELASCDAVVLGKFLVTPNRIRIQAQLIDAITGETLSAEKGEGDLNDKVTEIIDRVVAPLIASANEKVPALDAGRSAPADTGLAGKAREASYAHVLGGYSITSGKSANYFGNGFSGKAAVAIPMAKYIAPYGSAGALLYSGKSTLSNGAFYFADAGISVPLPFGSRFVLMPYLAAGIFGGKLASSSSEASLLAPAFDGGLYATYYFTQRLGLTLSASAFYVMDKPNDLLFTVVSGGIGLRF